MLGMKSCRVPVLEHYAAPHAVDRIKNVLWCQNSQVRCRAESHQTRKRPRSFLNVAFIYAGNYLLSHTCVGRTLLSAALDLGVLLICFGPRDCQKSKVKGSGRGRPLYTCGLEIVTF
jgi:hypothetical protein